jgi:hypothetical protein
MSLPYFDPEVRLQSAQVSGNRVVTDTFTATGDLREEQQSEELRVLVSIWQTEADTTPNGLATNIVARALGVGTQDADHPDRWSATLVTRAGGFKPDADATGLGHVVANDGDPTGFDTYTWTTRLRIKPAP